MSFDISKVTPATSLSISVSGTDYICKSQAAGVAVGVLPPTALQKDVEAGRETLAGALKRVPAETAEAIEAAMAQGNAAADAAKPNPSAQPGLYFSLIA